MVKFGVAEALVSYQKPFSIERQLVCRANAAAFEYRKRRFWMAEVQAKNLANEPKNIKLKVGLTVLILKEFLLLVTNYTFYTVVRRVEVRMYLFVKAAIQTSERVAVR